MVLGGFENSNYSEYFGVKKCVELPANNNIDVEACYSDGIVNYFAITLKASSDLLVISDGTKRTDSKTENSWCIRNIPWFNDGSKRISALAFDTEAKLYIGTKDGNLYELSYLPLFSTLELLESQVDLKLLFNNPDVKTVAILVHIKDRTKFLLLNGSNGKFVLVSYNYLPVLVTFTFPIVSMDLFLNRHDLQCLLVSLENGQNLYLNLEDLDTVSESEVETPGKKSIFRKAKENIMSKFSDDKIGFFRKSSKETLVSPGVINVKSQGSFPSVTTAISSLISKPPFPIGTVKFQAVEETHCRGHLKKIIGGNQFYRHLLTKMDIFDADFRQQQAIFVAPNMTELYVFQNVFYGIDEENSSIHCCLVQNGTLKEYASMDFRPKILSIEPIGPVDDAPYSAYIVAEDGIYDITLRKPPMEIAVELLNRDVQGPLMDILITSLKVTRGQVCIVAGDAKCSEGKFAKTILYYKLAGLSHSKIVAKFGSKKLIPAMLCFHELVEAERAKLAGNYTERKMMANLVLLGRIEQYLRHGKAKAGQLKDPKILLRTLLTSNMEYCSKRAVEYLSHQVLLWALNLTAKTRHSYSDVLRNFYYRQEITKTFINTKSFWDLTTHEWITIFSAPTSVFIWYRDVVVQNIKKVEARILCNLIHLFVPWRRELLKKMFCATDLGEIIDFTEANRVVLGDYIQLFINLLLESIKRKIKCKVPRYLYNSVAQSYQDRMQLKENKNSIAGRLLNTDFHRKFAASSNHCIFIRNGKVYSWGENKFGRLGISESEHKYKLIHDSPCNAGLSPSLRLPIVSVSCGQNHTVALTSVGTLLVWGNNLFGQLGVGQETTFSEYPIPIDIPNVIFTQVAAGSYHTLAIDHLHRVWTWGWNIHGQLGNGDFESSFYPNVVQMKEKDTIVQVSGGHSHSAFLTSDGRVYTCGCNHFGQLGLGSGPKVKKPCELNFPDGAIIRYLTCGSCSTVMVTTKNRVYYSGINPISIRSIMLSKKRQQNGPPQKDEIPEDRDHSLPIIIESTHISGDILTVDAGGTHLGVLTTLGLVYTWGIGKSGQLVRTDDDGRTLELIDTEDKTIIASDIVCAGDCTFIVEASTGRVFGCGFNSYGQLGKLEMEETSSSIMTIRTRKRVLKVRQPSNIYFRLREIHGLPRLIQDNENSLIEPVIEPPTEDVNQQLLEWSLKVLRKNYDQATVLKMALNWGNYGAAALLETLADNYDYALKYTLVANYNNKLETSSQVATYLTQVNRENKASVEQACRFLEVMINHWRNFGLNPSDLEEILEFHRNYSPWDILLGVAVNEIINSSSESAEWLSTHLTPLFILTALRESENVEGEPVELGLNRKAGPSSESEPFYESSYKANGLRTCPITQFSADDDNDIDIKGSYRDQIPSCSN